MDTFLEICTCSFFFFILKNNDTNENLLGPTKFYSRVYTKVKHQSVFDF